MAEEKKKSDAVATVGGDIIESDAVGAFFGDISGVGGEKMSISVEKCKKEGGKVFGLEDTGRKVCLLPDEKQEKKEKKVVLID